MNVLVGKNCVACSGKTPILDANSIQEYLQHLEHWELNSDQTEIKRSFNFKNYGQVMAFTQAIAWLAFKEGHHPDMEVSYNRCIIRFTTHEIKALSENDFICAAKADQIFAI